MCPKAFRPSDSPSLGVELEFQLLDERDQALAPAAPLILNDAVAAGHRWVKPEYHTCCVEINTAVCRDVPAVAADLGSKLDKLTPLTAARGFALGWGGTHPFSHWQNQEVFPDARYQELKHQYCETLQRQLTFGMHVHVGVADGDAAIAVCNGISGYLPALLAFSANSPFWCGRATGLHSHRLEIMGALPTGGLPPFMAGFEEYVKVTDHLIDRGVIHSVKELWWDVRPNSDLGTVEVRICDMPQDLDTALALTALIQCLVVDLSQCDRQAEGDPCTMIMNQQNRWRAGRYGLEASMVDPQSGREYPARAILSALAERLSPIACALGCTYELELSRRLIERPGGAQRQRTIFEQTRDLSAVARALVTWPRPAMPHVLTLPHEAHVARFHLSAVPWATHVSNAAASG
jgi:carboxylate-amine ligase